MSLLNTMSPVKNNYVLERDNSNTSVSMGKVSTQNKGHVYVEENAESSHINKTQSGFLQNVSDFKKTTVFRILVTKKMKRVAVVEEHLLVAVIRRVTLVMILKGERKLLVDVKFMLC